MSDRVGEVDPFVKTGNSLVAHQTVAGDCDVDRLSRAQGTLATVCLHVLTTLPRLAFVMHWA